MTSKALFIQKVVIISFLVITPFTLFFKPYSPRYAEFLQENGRSLDVLWDKPYTELRSSIIIWGIMGSIISMICTVLIWKADASRRLLSFTATFSTFFIGCSFPFWVGGLLQPVVYNAFDPKGQMPMIWFGKYGELWFVFILLLHLLSFVIIPSLVILTIVKKRKQQLSTRHLRIEIFFLLVLVLTHLNSYSYLVWLAD